MICEISLNNEQLNYLQDLLENEVDRLDNDPYTILNREMVLEIYNQVADWLPVDEGGDK